MTRGGRTGTLLLAGLLAAALLGANPVQVEMAEAMGAELQDTSVIEVTSTGALVQRGMKTCKTNSQGYCQVTHGLGLGPNQYPVMTPVLLEGGEAFLLYAVRNWVDEGTWRVRAMRSNTQPRGGSTITFSYVIWTAPGVAPPCGEG